MYCFSDRSVGKECLSGINVSIVECELNDIRLTWSFSACIDEAYYLFSSLPLLSSMATYMLLAISWWWLCYFCCTEIESVEVQDDDNMDFCKESNRKKAKTPSQLEALKEIYRG